MDSVKFSLLVLGLVLVIGTEFGSAIKCHVCTSGEDYDGKDCMDLKSGDEQFVKDCTEISRETGLNYTMCRKYDQTIEGEHRIDRDCAAEGSGRCILRTGTKEIKLEYCECKGDLCNAAPTVFSATTIISMLLSIAVAAMFRS